MTGEVKILINPKMIRFYLSVFPLFFIYKHIITYITYGTYLLASYQSPEIIVNKIL